MEKIPGVSERSIEDHAEAALSAFVAMEIIGALALPGLIFFRKASEFPRYFSLWILVFTLIAIILFTRTAYLGGHIRHTEIRSGFQTQGYPDINIRKGKDD